MSVSRKHKIAAAVAPLALVAAAPATSSAATAFYGVTSDMKLVEFQSDNPAQAPAKPIRGLAAGESIVGMDQRPKDLRLYALTNKSRIVVINPRNAAVRYLGTAPFTPPLTGDKAAFDVNPVVDAMRVETNAAQNLRIDFGTGQLVEQKATTPAPTTPAGTTPGTTPTTPVETTPATTPGKPDGAPAYAAGDPGFGTVPKVTAAAYTNSFPAGALSTELFVLDSARNVLAKQDPANDGTLRSVGGLGTTGEPIAFDIGSKNIGWAAIQSGGVGNVGLYRIDLTKGVAQRVGSTYLVGTDRPIVAMAAAGDINDDNTRPKLSVSASSTQLSSRLRQGGVMLTVNVNEAVTGTARVKYAGRTVGTSDVSVRGTAGYDRVTVKLPSSVKSALGRAGGVRLDLFVEVADGSGNRSTLYRPIRTR